VEIPLRIRRRSPSHFGGIGTASIRLGLQLLRETSTFRPATVRGRRLFLRGLSRMTPCFLYPWRTLRTSTFRADRGRQSHRAPCWGATPLLATRISSLLLGHSFLQPCLGTSTVSRPPSASSAPPRLTSSKPTRRCPSCRSNGGITSSCAARRAPIFPRRVSFCGRFHGVFCRQGRKSLQSKTAGNRQEW
jgi:hypothetical protein